MPQSAVRVIERLEENGFEAFAVGGCVRDYIMNTSCNDVDITTNATPFQIKQCFADCKTIDIGEKYGTVSVFFEDGRFEITTYRTDNGYADMRHPDSVGFCANLADDLKRRDFTINAMAYSKSGGFVDVFGGAEDIKRGVIRCVGNPSQRFAEDALRIMRALRFSSTLGFKLEENTKQAAFSCAHLLENISSERLRDELLKLICGKNADDVLIEYAEILAVFIPQISPCIGFDQHSRYHKYTVWEHIAKAVGCIKCDENARLCTLFHDIAKPACFSLDENGTGHFKGHAAVCAQTAQQIMQKLCFPTKQIELVKNVIYYHSDANYTERIVKRRISKLGFDGFELLLDLQCADNSAKHDFCKARLENLEQWRSYAKSLQEDNACISLKSMAVNGNDIKSLGFEGAAIGKVLNFLLELVMDEAIENDYNVLMKKAHSIKLNSDLF